MLFCVIIMACFQELAGKDPVWHWVTGSVLGPVIAALGTEDQTRFADLCKQRYSQAYPQLPDGVTMLPFPRLFMIVKAGSS